MASFVSLQPTLTSQAKEIWNPSPWVMGDTMDFSVHHIFLKENLSHKSNPKPHTSVGPGEGESRAPTLVPSPYGKAESCQGSCVRWLASGDPWGQTISKIICLRLKKQNHHNAFIVLNMDALIRAFLPRTLGPRNTDHRPAFTAVEYIGFHAMPPAPQSTIKFKSNKEPQLQGCQFHLKSLNKKSLNLSYGISSRQLHKVPARFFSCLRSVYLGVWCGSHLFEGCLRPWLQVLGKLRLRKAGSCR